MRISLPIETERLVLRAFTPADAEAMHAAWSDPEVMRWLPTEPSISLEESRERLGRLLERQRGADVGLWAVEERATGDVLGACGLFRVEGTGPEIEVAYHLARRHWGRGVATEAARACVETGLGVGIPAIVGFTDPANEASQGVLRKAGLRPDGRAQVYGFEALRFTTASVA